MNVHIRHGVIVDHTVAVRIEFNRIFVCLPYGIKYHIRVINIGVILFCIGNRSVFCRTPSEQRVPGSCECGVRQRSADAYAVGNGCGVGGASVCIEIQFARLFDKGHIGHPCLDVKVDIFCHIRIVRPIQRFNRQGVRLIKLNRKAETDRTVQIVECRDPVPESRSIVMTDIDGFVYAVRIGQGYCNRIYRLTVHIGHSVNPAPVFVHDHDSVKSVACRGIDFRYLA